MVQVDMVAQRRCRIDSVPHDSCHAVEPQCRGVSELRARARYESLISGFDPIERLRVTQPNAIGCFDYVVQLVDCREKTCGQPYKLDPKVANATFCTLPLESEVALWRLCVETSEQQASFHGCQSRSSLSACVCALVCRKCGVQIGGVPL